MMGSLENNSNLNFKVNVSVFLSMKKATPCLLFQYTELMKFGGKLFFEWDGEMYDPITDEPAKANTSDINEELGQVLRNFEVFKY